MTTHSTRFGGFFVAYDWRALLSHIKATEIEFWAHARTRTVQFMAGCASALWGVSLLFEQHSGFLNQGFTMMRDQAPASVWAAIFIGHTVCVFVVRWWPDDWWPEVMRRCQWATSFYGFVIWAYYVLATWFSSERYVIGTSFEIVAVFMLAWSLRRAGRDLKHGERDADAQ